MPDACMRYETRLEQLLNRISHSFVLPAREDILSVHSKIKMSYFRATMSVIFSIISVTYTNYRNNTVGTQ